MTSDLFEALGLGTSTTKKILLLVDNFPAHPVLEYLENIKLVFLSVNTTSMLQAMDKGR
jgi:hypothetical protein